MNYTANIGDPVTFQCVASGIPPPIITFFRNGIELTNAIPRVQLSSSYTSGSMAIRALTLATSDLRDLGTFECRATNNAIPGEVTMEFELIIVSGG